MLSTALLLLLELELVVGGPFKLIEFFLKLLYGCGKHLLVFGLACLELVGPRVIVVINQPRVGSLIPLCKFKPLFDFFQDFIFLDVEVTLYHTLKALGGFLDLSDHCKFDVAVANNVLIPLILLFSFRGTSFVFKPWFLKVNLL